MSIYFFKYKLTNNLNWIQILRSRSENHVMDIISPSSPQIHRVHMFWFFFFETSKNGTRRAYPPATTPPIKQVPFHPPNKLFWNLLLDLCIRAYVDIANPQLLIMVLCVVHDTCENRESITSLGTFSLYSLSIQSLNDIKLHLVVLSWKPPYFFTTLHYD